MKMCIIDRDYNAGFAANGPYKIPNAQVDAYVYMTNKTLGTAYRGFGVTEVATAHERQMDRIAEKLGIDPLELRLKNVLQNGDVGITGEIMQTMAVKECLETAAANIGWKDLPDRWTDEEMCIRDSLIPTPAFYRLTRRRPPRCPASGQ